MNHEAYLNTLRLAAYERRKQEFIEKWSSGKGDYLEARSRFYSEQWIENHNINFLKKQAL